MKSPQLQCDALVDPQTINSTTICCSKVWTFCSDAACARRCWSPLPSVSDGRLGASSASHRRKTASTERCLLMYFNPRRSSMPTWCVGWQPGRQQRKPKAEDGLHGALLRPEAESALQQPEHPPPQGLQRRINIWLIAANAWTICCQSRIHTALLQDRVSKHGGIQTRQD